MATTRVTAHRRRLSIESLEKRPMLAAHINELMVDPLFASGNNRQYIELRGEPNATLPDGSYLACPAVVRSPKSTSLTPKATASPSK